MIVVVRVTALTEIMIVPMIMIVLTLVVVLTLVIVLMTRGAWGGLRPPPSRR